MRIFEAAVTPLFIVRLRRPRDPRDILPDEPTHTIQEFPFETRDLAMVCLTAMICHYGYSTDFIEVVEPRAFSYYHPQDGDKLSVSVPDVIFEVTTTLLLALR